MHVFERHCVVMNAKDCLGKGLQGRVDGMSPRSHPLFMSNAHA